MADLQPLLPRRISQSVFPPIGDAPLPDLTVPQMPSSNPLGTIAPPSLPNVIDNPRLSANSSDPLVNRGSALESDLYKRENPIAPTTTLGKIGHVAAGIGNVLGDIFAPATMTLIPGTQLHNEAIEQRDKADINDISTLQNQQAQRKQTAALTDYTEQRPEIAMAGLQRKMEIAQLKTDELAASHGQKRITDPNTGQDSYQDDPALLAHAAQQAQIDQRNAEAELANAKRDPSDPYYQQIERKVAVSRANAQAAQIRANAYMGNYKEHAYNVGLDGKVLPGAPQITDDRGNVTTVGSTNAAQAVKANANVGQFGDVAGATDNIEQTAKSLVDSGGRLNSPSVVYALQNTHGTPSQILQSVDKSNLTPQEREYVISNLAYRENLQALRKSAGGTVSDSAVDRLEQLAPSGSTPDLPYLLSQTGQIRQTWSRLGKGVATAQGGLKLPSENGNSAPPNSSSSPKVKKFNPATGRLE